MNSLLSDMKSHVVGSTESMNTHWDKIAKRMDDFERNISSRLLA